MVSLLSTPLYTISLEHILVVYSLGIFYIKSNFLLVRLDIAMHVIECKN